MNTKRLLVIYLSALALLLVSVLASVIVTEMKAGLIAEDANNINVAGRQRMLSQRIIYLSQDLSLNPGPEMRQTREDLELAINELGSAVSLFESSHARLSGQPDLSDARRALYFDAQPVGQTLDERVSEYLIYARAILADPTNQAALSGLRRIEQADFTYSVSHDLKSPANTISLALTEFLHQEGTNLSEDSRSLIDMACETASRIGVQVEDILAYALATKSAENAAPVELRACIDEALANLAGKIAQTNAEISVDVLGQIVASRRQIVMLVQNLIENALTYHAPGDPPKVTVTSHPGSEAGSIALSVSDKGIGIAPENHARIFKLFERLHLRQHYSGTGLGLATCKRVAQNYGGDINVRSELGEGTRFDVTLKSVVGTSADADTPTPQWQEAA